MSYKIRHCYRNCSNDVCFDLSKPKISQIENNELSDELYNSAIKLPAYALNVTQVSLFESQKAVLYYSKEGEATLSLNFIRSRQVHMQAKSP